MDILIPEVGESIREALLAQWFKKNGDRVAKDEPLCELETDKITLDVNSDANGILTILAEAGKTLAVGTKIGEISENTGPADPEGTENGSVPPAGSTENSLKAVATSPSIRQTMREEHIDPDTLAPTGKGGRITLDDLFARIGQQAHTSSDIPSDPSPKLDIGTLFSSLSANPPSGMPDKEPVPSALSPTPPAVTQPVTAQAVHVQPEASAVIVRSEETPAYASRSEERVALSPIRKRIAERLVSARQQTAMLTTFNEADLSHVKSLREKYREHFVKRHGSPLGLMPFFVRACCEALRQFPLVNASIDGDQIVYHHYYDIGIAIGAEKGLVVPVLRSADTLRLFEVDQAIAGFSQKIATNKLAISDLEGGTFTISNGGIYGSMLSTPILNPPQSGVLGMHAIQDRPVVRDGQIVIRPMMYLALSYDHRLVDGREAVNFLKAIKEYVENPEELLLEG